MLSKLTLSTLPHTWILDFDGTLVKHNGYKIDGYDTLLNGVQELFSQIPTSDMIILLTSRGEQYRQDIEKFMQQKKLRYNHIICNAPMGERILVNDDKPSGLRMAYAINKTRDSNFITSIQIDKEI